MKLGKSRDQGKVVWLPGNIKEQTIRFDKGKNFAKCTMLKRVDVVFYCPYL